METSSGHFFHQLSKFVIVICIVMNKLKIFKDLFSFQILHPCRFKSEKPSGFSFTALTLDLCSLIEMRVSIYGGDVVKNDGGNFIGFAILFM